MMISCKSTRDMIVVIVGILCMFTQLECRGLNTRKQHHYIPYDSLQPFIARPRYGGYGKRTIDEDGKITVYKELKDLTSKDIEIEPIVVVEDLSEKEDGRTNMDNAKHYKVRETAYEDIKPQLLRYRYIFRHFGGKKDISRPRFNGKKDASPKFRWGRFGKRSAPKASRWGRFGDEESELTKPVRWRFGGDSISDDNVEFRDVELNMLDNNKNEGDLD